MQNSKATLREWYAKWQKIKAEATTPEARAYAEQYLAFLAKQAKDGRE